MTNMLSNWAREFLREDRVAVVSTLNKDGSSHVTTIWYLGTRLVDFLSLKTNLLARKVGF
jgi:predicted pyridoxine 5'-phosphate oxidase superfamily flavin-nucleotide-binding protein